MRLMEHLPQRVYHGEAHVADIQDALQIEIEKLQAARDDLLEQAHPRTATWGLERYEREYGITPDSRKTPGQRLARWRSKRRGAGTSTKALIKAVAESYIPGGAEVHEYPREYRFSIVITVKESVLPNLNDMVESVREIQPAHLALSVIIYLSAPTGGIHLGAGYRYGQMLTVHPWKTEPIDSAGTAHLGAESLWGQVLTIQPKEA